MVKAAVGTMLVAPLLVVCLARAAGETAEWGEPILPPVADWDGESRALLLPPQAAWVTPFESGGGDTTPSYPETVAWLQRLSDAVPQVKLLSIGRSHEGRAIQMLVVSAGGASTAEALRREGRPTLLVHAGIHAGEIDGKDAGLMLVRDLTVGGGLAHLLEKANLLFIPVLNVDGHERVSRWGRINQRGPRETGWRTNARNQNLNRDFAKLDTPEVRALVAVINHWQPDLYVDIHVTDGMDHRYDITWGYNGPHAWSPRIAAWLDLRLTPAVGSVLAARGHNPAPLFFAVDRRDVTRGLVEWTATPRYSNGYGDARHLPTILVENHSLKPYERRVLGTYVFLESVLEVLGRQGQALRRAVVADRAARPARPPLGWQVPADPGSETFALAGIEQRLVASPASGEERVEWTGRPVDLEVPWVVMSESAGSIRAPAAYWIPATFPEVIQRLELHGLRLEKVAAPQRIQVEMYRLEDVSLNPEPFEGRVRVAARTRAEERWEVFPAGSVRVPLDQPLGLLAMQLLEPDAPDSFFQWGFFLESLQRTEYVEDYIIDPMADALLQADLEVREAFQEALEDPDFAGDPQRRRQWFYQRTPWFDDRWRLYPIGRELSPRDPAR